MPDQKFARLFLYCLPLLLGSLSGCASRQAESYRAFGISDEELAPPPALAPLPDENESPPPRRFLPPRPAQTNIVAPAASISPMPPEAPPVAQPQTAAADADIERFVEHWRQAWAARDVDAYLAHYLPDYRGSANTAAEWRDGRKRVLTNSGQLDIRLSALEVQRNGSERAEVDFEQSFRSAKLADRVRKHLSLVRHNGNWLIERERFTPIDGNGK
jgi:ketosteroid isomerase-like protein